MDANAELKKLVEPYKNIDFYDNESRHISAARLLIEFQALAVINARLIYPQKDSWRNQTPLETITCEGEAIRALREGRAPDFSKFKEADSERLLGLKNINSFRISEDFETKLRGMKPEAAIDKLVLYVANECFHS